MSKKVLAAIAAREKAKHKTTGRKKTVGGPLKPGTGYVVGEKGPEKFVPPQDDALEGKAPAK